MTCQALECAVGLLANMLADMLSMFSAQAPAVSGRPWQAAHVPPEALMQGCPCAVAISGENPLSLMWAGDLVRGGMLTLPSQTVSAAVLP